MQTNFKILLGFLLVISGCSKNDGGLFTDQAPRVNLSASAGAVKVSKLIVGDPADVTKVTTGGTCLMGGSTDVDAAFKWMIGKSGGGDFVIIRCDNSTGYNSYVYNMGGVNSVETIIIAKASDANNPVIANRIREAEALFIAGGDQKNYVMLWKNSLVEDAINYLINTKNVPVGGTSAGCAILGSSYFAALNGTVTSADALGNPYNPLVTLGHDDFINNPFLQNTITDQHFTQRAREGRLVTFMARMNQDLGKNARGIASDEQTAVCVDENGIAKVFGVNNAFFLQITSSGPETCSAGIPLTWNNDTQAIKVYRIAGSSAGNGSFNLNTFSTSKASGGYLGYYYVIDGIFTSTLK
jgi:cyanophycinase